MPQLSLYLFLYQTAIAKSGSSLVRRPDHTKLSNSIFSYAVREVICGIDFGNVLDFVQHAADERMSVQSLRKLGKLGLDHDRKGTSSRLEFLQNRKSGWIMQVVKEVNSS